MYVSPRDQRCLFTVHHQSFKESQPESKKMDGLQEAISSEERRWEAEGRLLGVLPQPSRGPANCSLYETPWEEAHLSLSHITPPHLPPTAGSQVRVPTPSLLILFFWEENWGKNPLWSPKESDPMFPDSSLSEKKINQMHENVSPLKRRSSFF